MKKISKIFILVLLSAVIALSGFMVINDLIIQQKEKEEFASLYEITVINQNDIPTSPIADPVSYVNNKKADNDKSDYSENYSDDEYQIHSIQDLISMNSDCFGWISIPGTNINYPVMHTPNDPQKYLNRSFYGEYSQSGVPFLDVRCSKESTNLIMYGHNMNNGSMFADLCNYVNYSYYTAHPTVVLETKGNVLAYTIFSVMTVKSDDFWYSFTKSMTEKRYNSIIEYAKIHSIYDTGITPVYGQQILTLSTCYGSTKDSRILVLAVKN